MTGTILVTAQAYAIKAERGGGFRGIARAGATEKRGERRDSFEEAKNDAKRFALELLAGRRCRCGYVWRRQFWLCNYWMA